MVVLHLKNKTDLERMISGLKKAYSDNLLLQNLPQSSISIGQVISDKKYNNLLDLIEVADQNMYTKKS
ncbi:Diguanylate cyclase, GGDEF domain [Pseudoalteromonas denitrificans DSM 6059]|uniref:Diguanylate cyclase, GGDEF domain n=1 Tax=Pseudoalteromonas denitrificans DSM 6059 TaxID=1123010 RepID=A0A1I1I5H8_9GAMM|nr:diguanylate cyclase [Pseudoalteromonas denitrificans]SFC31295.1 Diguanylate cyclase, GGDEF domain [Pseudoalteromonas denitrificans DSM 6059]